MTTQHTPGPWRVEEQPYKSSAFYIRGTKPNGKPMTWGLGAVAHIPRSTVLPSEANARLIAAAPELLEALQNCLEQIAGGPDGSRVYFAAKKVIAKATGGQP